MTERTIKRNASQSFADGTAKENRIVFYGDLCVGKNTPHGAHCASGASAGSAVLLPEKTLAFFRSMSALSTCSSGGLLSA